MVDQYTLWPDARDKVQYLIKVRVARKSIYLLCLAADRNNFDLAGLVHHANFRHSSVKDTPAKCAINLVRDKDDFVLWVWCKLFEVLYRWAAFKHPRCCHHDCGIFVTEYIIALAISANDRKVF